MRMPFALLAVLACGCYQPHPPAGAYTCSADNACPSGQHCTCGLCVAHDEQAACSFALAATVPAGGVAEHEPFALHVQALTADGAQTASAFAGTVTLSSSWGDVRVAGTSGATLQLTEGVADAMVTLNRETLAPQTAAITAHFGHNSGSSNRIGVLAPQLIRDSSAIVPPVSAAQPFGFAATAVGEPDVHELPDGWRMYFASVDGTATRFGVATSSDGLSFTPPATPILSSGGESFDAAILSPSVFAANGAYNLAFAGTDLVIDTMGSIGLASSSDGLSPFAIGNAGQPIIAPADCGYCDKGVSFPSVVPDPANPGQFIMFFSANASVGANSSNAGVSIGRAGSMDGVHFTPEPAAVLTSQLGGEAILVAPRVLLDGSVYKMWYSYARVADYKEGDLCASTINVGYATSADGFYWIRSENNPQLVVDGSGWDGAITAFLVGSVVPSDGSDAQNGLSLYYSTIRSIPVGNGTMCVPNGIGRATRR